MQSQDEIGDHVADEPQARRGPYCDAEKAANEGATETIAQSPPPKKSTAFYFAFLSLLIVVLIVSLDATILAVAIPESRPLLPPYYKTSH
jgi:hypothetical protein